MSIGISKGYHSRSLQIMSIQLEFNAGFDVVLPPQCLK